jgi:hypothetical protein
MTKVFHPANTANTASGNMPGKIILVCIKYPTKFVGYLKLVCNSLLFTAYPFVHAAPAAVCRRALYTSPPPNEPRLKHTPAISII